MMEEKLTKMDDENQQIFPYQSEQSCRPKVQSGSYLVAPRAGWCNKLYTGLSACYSTFDSYSSAYSELEGMAELLLQDMAAQLAGSCLS